MEARVKHSVAQGTHVDPVVTEIVRNGLIAATEEMKTNLMRTAYNMIIYEALDFTVGLFDADGNTISIGLGLPMFIRGMSETVKAKIAHFEGDLEPGDILLTNDAYITGSHLNHMTFTVPVFHDGELVAFSCCMAHWPDVGGTLSGATTDIYSEGLQMPIVKIYRKGVINGELVSIIKTNVRLAERAMGDFRAQVAAVKTGEKRFLELIGKYGRDEVLAAIDAIMEHSEKIARERVAAMPDGVYEAESFMDDDGVSVGVPGQGRPHDGRSHRHLRAGRRLLQLRRHRRPLLLSGRLQVSDVCARHADQRGAVPRARRHSPAGQGRQRAEACRHAHVDDLSDDGRRHDLQGDVAGDAGQGRGGPSRGPRGRARQWTAAGRQLVLHLSWRTDRRRLGRQAQWRWHERDHRHQ
jgi:hypothetical protein